MVSYLFPSNQEPSTAGRLLGDTQHFCPVALKNNNVLIPCKGENAVKYRERTFYLSSLEARDSFLENPVQFVAQTEPLKVRTAMKMKCQLRKEQISYMLRIFYSSSLLPFGYVYSALEDRARPLKASGWQSSSASSIFSTESSSK